MQVFAYHVFVCDQQKAEGLPCCSARGSAEVVEELRSQVARQGLAGTVHVTVCGSFGLCESGPNMVVYPEGTWYSGVQAADVAEIVTNHLRGGKVVERLVNRDAAGVRAEIARNRARMIEGLQAKDASGALPDPLLQSIRAFQESRTILTGIELDVFTAVGPGGTASEVAGKIHADPRATEMLLNALVAMRLLEKRGDTFAATPVSSRYLASGGRDDSRAALMHTAHLWNTWSNLTDSVLAGTAVARQGAPSRDSDWTEAFIAAMHKNATERAGAIVRAVRMEAAQTMLDVGGGSGAYAIAFARANPQLRVDVLDLPSVTPITDRHIRAASLQDRIRTRNGDLRTDPLGLGYDIVLVSAICHMLSPDENRDLLRRCSEALVPGGRIVIQDFILEPSKTAPKSAALFALNMLVGTQAGSTYAEHEYTRWLHESGFARVEHVRLPGPGGLMMAVRPRG
ncbi:MAG: methyltransferase [Acidobacteriota bacterium]